MEFTFHTIRAISSSLKLLIRPNHHEFMVMFHWIHRLKTSYTVNRRGRAWTGSGRRRILQEATYEQNRMRQVLSDLRKKPIEMLILVSKLYLWFGRCFLKHHWNIIWQNVFAPSYSNTDDGGECLLALGPGVSHKKFSWFDTKVHHSNHCQASDFADLSSLFYPAIALSLHVNYVL